MIRLLQAARSYTEEDQFRSAMSASSRSKIMICWISLATQLTGLPWQQVVPVWPWHVSRAGRPEVPAGRVLESRAAAVLLTATCRVEPCADQCEWTRIAIGKPRNDQKKSRFVKFLLPRSTAIFLTAGKAQKRAFVQTHCRASLQSNSAAAASRGTAATAQRHATEFGTLAASTEDLIAGQLLGSGAVGGES